MLPSHFITARNIGGTDVYNFVIVFKSIEVHILFTTYILSVHFFYFVKAMFQSDFYCFKVCFFFLIFDSWCGVKALKIHYCDNTLTLLIFFFKTVSFKYFHFILFLELVISKTHDNGGNNALIIFSH